MLAMLLTLAPMNIFAADADKTAFSDMKETDYYAQANIYYPGAILLGIIVLLILNKKFWSLNHIYLIIAILGMIVFIFVIPLLFDALFGAQLRDLYLRGYENLLDIVSYYRDVVRNNLD